MEAVQFKPTELLCPVKQGGTLEVGKVFTGTLNKRGDKIYFTDKNESEWVFYPGYTCEFVNN